MAEKTFFLTKQEYEKSIGTDIDFKIDALTGETFENALRYMHDNQSILMKTIKDEDARVCGYVVHSSDHPEEKCDSKDIPDVVLEFLNNRQPMKDFDSMLGLYKMRYKKLYLESLTR